MFRINFNHWCQRIALWLIVLHVIVACATYRSSPKDSAPTDVQKAELPDDAVPRHEPRSKYGNPKSYVVFGKRYYTLPSSNGYVERGIASWYGKKFHGRRTSSGETYNMYEMTAAHKELPLPTYVQVTNLKNGRQVILRVNDRGPFHGNRIIDLSYSAASKLGIVREGTGLVEVRALDPSNYSAHSRKVKNISSASKNNSENLEITEQEAVNNKDDADNTDANSVAEANPQVFIQVGAFGERENANQLVNQLSALNLGEVSVSSIIKNSQQLHRVRIGPLSTIELADKTVAQLTSMGMNDHRVVIE